MRRLEKIGSELGISYPGGRRQKGRDGQQQSRAEQGAANETEKGASEAVGKAQADGASAATEETAEESGRDGHRGEDQEKCRELGDRRGGNEAGEGERAIFVKPAGKWEAE